MGRTEAVLDALFGNNFAWAGRKTAEDPTVFRRLAEQQAPRFLRTGCRDCRAWMRRNPSPRGR